MVGTKQHGKPPESLTSYVFLWIYRGIMLPSVTFLLIWIWNLDNQVGTSMGETKAAVDAMKKQNEAAFAELAKYEQVTAQLTKFESYIRGYTQAISDGNARPMTIKFEGESLLRTLAQVHPELAEELPEEPAGEAVTDKSLKQKVSKMVADWLETDAERKAKEQAEKLRKEVEKLQAEQQQMQQQMQQQTQAPMMNPDEIKELDEDQLKRYIDNKTRQHAKTK